MVAGSDLGRGTFIQCRTAQPSIAWLGGSLGPGSPPPNPPARWGYNPPLLVTFAPSCLFQGDPVATPLFDTPEKPF